MIQMKLANFVFNMTWMNIMVYNGILVLISTIVNLHCTNIISFDNSMIIIDSNEFHHCIKYNVFCGIVYLRQKISLRHIFNFLTVLEITLTLKLGLDIDFTGSAVTIASVLSLLVSIDVAFVFNRLRGDSNC